MTIEATVNINSVDNTTLVHNTGNEDIAGVKSFTGFVNNSLGIVIASAETISPVAQIFHVSGTSNISTITPPTDFNNGVLYIIPDDVFTTDILGNIALASTSVVNQVLIMVYDATQEKWYPSY